MTDTIQVDRVDTSDEPLQLAWLDDEGQIHIGPARRLASHIDNANLTGTAYVTKVYVEQDGGLVEAEWKVTGGQEIDDNDFRYPTVEVTAPDGTVTTATYRVDGRA